MKPFAGEKFLLKICGIWSPDHYNNKFEKIFYTVYRTLFLFTMVYFYTFSELMGLLKSRDSFEEIAAASFLWFTQFAMSIKASFALWNLNKIKEIVAILDSDIFLKTFPNQEKLVRDTSEKNFTFFKYLVFSSYITIIVWVVEPIVNAQPGMKPMPMRAWFFYDTNISPMYELTYAYLAFGIYVSISINWPMDNLTYGLMRHGCTQLKLLKEILKNIDTYSVQTLKTRYQNDYLLKSGDDFNDALEAEINLNLKICIEHHKAIVEFLKNTESAFNKNIFAQYLCSGLTICITTFLLTIISPLSVNGISMLIYLALMLLQIFLYCWFGNEVTVESNGIVQAIYLSNWIKFNKKTNKTLLIIMEKCKKPIVMKAGKFFDLSLDLYVAILKTSYSYYALLKQISDE